ncbi:MAG: hypothetical protein J0653_05705, partial [Deltaproteobacteria bacterium]|nr:hypothetical protein [Deltaproteobacteria bacterium]
NALVERYRDERGSNDLFPEYDWLRELESVLLQRADMTEPPHGTWNRHRIKERFDKIRERIGA